MGSNEIELGFYLIIEYPVIVAFAGLELDREAAEISNGIRRTLLGPNGRYSYEDFCLLSDICQEVGVCEITDIVGDFEVSTGSGGFSMDASFRDSFSEEVSQIFNQLRASQ